MLARLISKKYRKILILFFFQNLNPQSLSRFANCLQNIAGLLECPVCLEIIKPPTWQCCHGHLICSSCRSRSHKCPICRVTLGRGRSIIADKLFHFLAQTLGNEGKLFVKVLIRERNIGSLQLAMKTPLFLLFCNFQKRS